MERQVIIRNISSEIQALEVVCGTIQDSQFTPDSDTIATLTALRNKPLRLFVAPSRTPSLLPILTLSLLLPPLVSIPTFFLLSVLCLSARIATLFHESISLTLFENSSTSILSSVLSFIRTLSFLSMSRRSRRRPRPRGGKKTIAIFTSLLRLTPLSRVAILRTPFSFTPAVARIVSSAGLRRRLTL